MTETGLIGRLVGAGGAPRIGGDRLIASGRVVLAAFSLLVWLDPATPAQHAPTTHRLLLAYLGYALLVMTIVSLAHRPLIRLGLATHVLDLLAFCGLTYLTQGPTSPFFAFFIFAIVAATLRWQWRGALWTAAAALVTLIGLGLYADEILGDPAFEQTRFIIPSAYLAVTAGLLAYLGAYEERRRREVSELAAWPQILAREPEVQQRETLARAARILGAARTLVAWEESEEPWLHLALWDGGPVRSWREAPETFHPVVVEPLAAIPFLSPNVAAPMPAVLYHSTDGMRGWRGAPIQAALHERFAMRSVLCLPLRGELLDGHLFALDKPGLTGDDLLLGEVVAHQVAASMDQALLSRRLRQAAAAEERTRLSRNLHDGLLQSLTGAALQLETVQRVWDAEPKEARERLAAIQRSIAEEQRDLRVFIRDSRLPSFSVTPGTGGVHASLRKLAQRLEALWDLWVELHIGDLDAQSWDPLAYEICFIVQEAVVNAARHAAATEVHLAIGATNGTVHIVVTDNGRGFPFQGEYDDATLTALRLGPVTLKERVRSLNGTLAVRSTTEGAQLDIRLPRNGGGV